MVFDAIKTRQLEAKIEPGIYPNLYAWHVLVSRFSHMTALGWPESEKQDAKVALILESLRAETKEEGEERREKQKWDNYVPASEKRPVDEWFDLTSIQSDCIGGEPIDITADQDGGLLKFNMKPSTSKFPRLVEEADIVHYFHETRFDNG